MSLISLLDIILFSIELTLIMVLQSSGAISYSTWCDNNEFGRYPDPDRDILSTFAVVKEPQTIQLVSLSNRKYSIPLLRYFKEQ